MVSTYHVAGISKQEWLSQLPHLAADRNRCLGTMALFRKRMIYLIFEFPFPHTNARSIVVNTIEQEAEKEGKKKIEGEVEESASRKYKNRKKYIDDRRCIFGGQYKRLPAKGYPSPQRDVAWHEAEIIVAIRRI